MARITAEQFREITKGHPAHAVARVLQQSFTRGTCWSGCSKALMCESITGDKDGRGGYTYADRVDPAALRAKLAEDAAWRAKQAAQRAAMDAEDAKRDAVIRARQVAVYKAAQSILKDPRIFTEARLCAEYARNHIPLHIRDAVDTGKA